MDKFLSKLEELEKSLKEKKDVLKLLAPKSKKKLKKSELIKSLEDAGLRESALLLKNWNEKDEIAKEFEENNS